MGSTQARPATRQRAGDPSRRHAGPPGPGAVLAGATVVGAAAIVPTPAEVPGTGRAVPRPAMDASVGFREVVSYPEPKAPPATSNCHRFRHLVRVPGRAETARSPVPPDRAPGRRVAGRPAGRAER